MKKIKITNASGITLHTKQTLVEEDIRIIIDESLLKTYEAEPYKGVYDVTPNIFKQTLETKNKRMMDDVRVSEIPFATTTNLSGGFTVIIGATPTYQNGETIEFFKMEEN